MAPFAQYTGLVTNSDGKQISLREGEIWPADDITVKEHPEKFTETEPNSEVAGAFPMEHANRSTEMTDGDAVEEKRWEGERPRGYAVPGEDPETGEKIEKDSDAGEEQEPAKQERGAGNGPTIERATRAPGEKRTTIKKSGS